MLGRDVLFICTGNYYRSRFAELLFNHLAKLYCLPIRSFSKGIEPYHVDNVGLISQHTVDYLTKLGVDLTNLSEPLPLTEQDFDEGAIAIAMSEKEHRPMMAKKFPRWENCITYWNFEDEYLISPTVLLPRLEERVKALLGNLKTDNYLP